MKGSFTYYYTAMGLEMVTVPFGSFDAMRINVEVQMEIGAAQQFKGTYTESLWFVPDVGLGKSEGDSQIPGVKFTDTLELLNYDSP